MKRRPPRRSGVGLRQVLIPGTNIAAPHAWRDLLRASREGKPTTREPEGGES